MMRPRPEWERRLSLLGRLSNLLRYAEWPRDLHGAHTACISTGSLRTGSHQGVGGRAATVCSLVSLMRQSSASVFAYGDCRLCLFSLFLIVFHLWH